MTATGRKIHLLIGAGSFTDAKPAFLVAEALMGAGIGDVSGILVEEEQDFEALPAHARCVITPSGTVCTTPPPAERRMLLESDAKAFRDNLIRLAENAPSNWRFERQKGESVSRLMYMKQAWDLLVIGHRTIGHQTGSVLALLSEGETAGNVRELSQRLSMGLRTAVLEVGKDLSASEVIKTVNKTRAAAIVIDAASDLFHDKAQFRRLIEAARCPVLVVKTSEEEERPTNKGGENAAGQRNE